MASINPIELTEKALGSATSVESSGLSARDTSDCLAIDCDKPSYNIRGWCNAHYHRWRTYGNPLGGGPHRDQHGMSKTPTYRSWVSMKNRCYDDKNIRFAKYGGRGIKVCDRWLTSFRKFHEDMGTRPAMFSLGRISRDGNYEPSNCRWETAVQQANNTTRNMHIVYRGETKTLAEWSRTTGVSRMTIAYRLKSGWSTERALL